MADDTWQDYLQQAHDHLRNKNVEQAGASFTLAIELCPDNARLYVIRAQFYSECDKFDRAIADLSAAIELMPNTPMFFVARGKAYTDIGDLDHAIDDYTSALELSKQQQADIYHRRALLYKKQDKHTLAVADFTSAASHNPRSFRHILERATVYEQIGDLASACADLERVLELCGPEHPEVPAVQEQLATLRDHLALS